MPASPEASTSAVPLDNAAHTLHIEVSESDDAASQHDLPPYDLPHSSSTANEPSYFAHQWSRLNLPSGYFILKNKAPLPRTFDVSGHGTADGTEVCAHPIKKPFIQQGSASLQHTKNNQLFYLSWTGHLMPACADGRVVDCIDSQLQLTLPPPIYAFPSRASHPMPRFRLDPETSLLHVQFETDPSFPGPELSSRHDLNDDLYIVEQSTRQKVEKREDAWTSAISFGQSLFSRLPINSPPTPSTSTTNDSEDSDDEPEGYRPLRVIRLTPNWREKFPKEVLASPPPTQSQGTKEPGHIRKWRRRQWEAVPVVVRSKAEFENPIKPLPSLPSINFQQIGNMMPQVDVEGVRGKIVEFGSSIEKSLPKIGGKGIEVTGDEGMTQANDWGDARVLPTEEIADLAVPRHSLSEDKKASDKIDESIERQQDAKASET